MADSVDFGRARGVVTEQALEILFVHAAIAQKRRKAVPNCIRLPFPRRREL
jgi:hypothetical protein